MTVPAWKIAVAVRQDLEAWQKLNLTSFVVSGLGTRHPELFGEPCIDGSGRSELLKFALPVLIWSRGSSRHRTSVFTNRRSRSDRQRLHR